MSAASSMAQRAVVEGWWGAVLAAPVAAARHLRRRWWATPPFLPSFSKRHLAWRKATAYGSADHPLEIADLVDEVRALRSPSPIIAVDHEGGRVQRFRDGFTAIPPMRVIGRQYRTDPKAALALARQAGWLIASELRACGIDLCFAPCVDLDWGVSEIIGDRAFHARPEVVADLSAEFCRGLRSAGMAAVAKHFPGHGDNPAPLKGVIGSDQRTGLLLEALTRVVDHARTLGGPVFVVGHSLGGAVALAAVLAGKVDTEGKTTVVVASGGNVDIEQYAEIQRSG